MNLSPHFTLEELTFSQIASRLQLDNTPSSKVIDNLKGLALVLEKIRAYLNRPIIISSGYRSTEVNNYVGGAPTSTHTQGLAADINCAGMSPKELMTEILKSGIQFDQLILESPNSNGWVHVGLSLAKPRHEILTAIFTNGKASYQSGIVG